MTKCSIPSCRLPYSAERKLNYHFFRLPKKQELRKKWLDSINSHLGKRLQIYKYTFLCERHFEQDCLIYSDGYKFVRLKKDAIPTLFEEDRENGDKDIHKQKSDCTVLIETLNVSCKPTILKRKTPKKLSITPIHNSKAKGQEKKINEFLVGEKQDNTKLPTRKSARKSGVKIKEKRVEKSPPKIGKLRDVEPTMVTKRRREKATFECPKCKKVFPAFISAHNHIVEYHCINSLGQKVSPSSIDLIRPIRVETCHTCNRYIQSNKQHFCAAVFEPGMEKYICSGCYQKFNNVKLYDLHVQGVHCDGVESLFFPNYDEFILWKNDVEKQMNIKYLMMNKINSKQYYRCDRMSINCKEDEACLLCPSTIVTQEFSKGIQVHFYKLHYGHPQREYTLNDEFRSYSLTQLIKNSEAYKDIDSIEADEHDIYMQFRKLMESIVVNAAKLKLETLNVLTGKALEMTSILTNYVEDDDNETNDISYLVMPPQNKILTEKQISRALDDLNKTAAKLKRKSSVEKEVVEKKSRTVKVQKVLPNDHEIPEIDDKTTPKIVNTYSLKDMTGSRTLRSKEVKIDENVPEVAIVEESNPAIVQSPSFNDSYKEFVDKQKQVKPDFFVKKGRRPVIRTKLGQFSPKKASPKPEPTESVIVHPVKVEKYEVKEQDNDCNILILKI